jgi:RimJ/RimL family protein N-acetyltransferase
MMEVLFFDRARNNDDDLRSLLRLKSEPLDVYWSGYVREPDMSKFKMWFEEQMGRLDREIWLVKGASNIKDPLGYLYLTYMQADEKRIGHISHGVAENSAGKGVGTAIVNFAVNLFINGYLKIDGLEAWIVAENVASIKTFEKNRFVKSPNHRKEFYKSMGTEVVLDSYFYNHFTRV